MYSIYVYVFMYVCMYVDGSAVPRGGGVVGSRNNNMTEQQKMSLMVIKERDSKIVSNCLKMCNLGTP